MPFLDWVNKNQAVSSAANVPYHLLQLEKTYGDAQAAQKNLIIQGDNLQALKALLPFYTGKVKCIFIDPPYNTGSAFEHYDDKLEHSQWLSMMHPRLVLLRELLSEDGSIWITIDDSEAHYLKVLCDEIFGRNTFIASNVWQKRYSRENREAIGDVHDYVFVYAKCPEVFKKNRNLVPLTEDQAKIYKNPNNDPRGRWRAIPMTAQGWRPNQMYPITTPTGVVHLPPEGRCWGMVEGEFKKMLELGRVYFGKDGNAQPSIIRYLSEVDGFVPWTWWSFDEVGHTDEAKKEILTLFSGGALFDTPKPERLINRVFHIATNPGDLILDSFLGSGTSAAVAHKMGRRYIGVEMGEHAQTHCIPRLQKVLEGEQGGISSSVNWQGGGGFSFYTLGDAVFDEHGHISPNVRFKSLAAYIWLLETKTAIATQESEQSTPFIGEHEGVAYYLLYNGILGDRRPNGGNVLTNPVLTYLESVYPHAGKKVIFGEASRISAGKLALLNISFKQIPYELHERI